MNKKILALIPARMGSSRFPGKPMTLINGTPMIRHVYDRVSQTSELTLTAVATPDIEIYDYIRSIGGVAIMTGDHHERASDRCAEALNILETGNNIIYDVVVMVQGDEPMTNADMIRESVTPVCEDANIHVVNLLGEIADIQEFEDRNCIKVVCDLNHNALYFSRQPIPTASIAPKIPMGKQVCVISFRRDFLMEYTRMAPTPLEIAESVDMMRILEHGIKIKMVPTTHQSYSVDVIEDVKRVEGKI